jgi:uncharacterized protein involved in exopolysaccharide biosynthesis
VGGLMIFLTKDQPKNYKVQTSIYTGISTGSSITNIGNEKVDFFGSQAQYNNVISILKSKSVIEETSLRLLARVLMLEEPDPVIISRESYAEFLPKVPDDVRALVAKNDEEKTYQNLIGYKNQSKDNFIYELLQYDHPFFSQKAVSKVSSMKEGGDMVKLSYEGSDPGIIYQTIKIMIEVFIDRYGDLKDAQTEAIVKYFEQKLQEASLHLSEAEDRLLEFNTTNNIINYYEQTKHISSQQETIELTMQDVLMDYEASASVLAKLEEETQARYQINLKNVEINELRKELISLNEKIASLELEEEFAEASPNRQNLIRQRTLIADRLGGKLDSLYFYERNSEGIALENLLQDWLVTVIEYESSRSRLEAMKRKREEFNQQYVQFAPLGAILKRIEREIDVKEREYLEILHHLGLAKLKQQNDSMTSNMKILDEPQFPINAAPSKRKLLIAIAAVFSMVFVVVGALMFELLDRTIKTPERLLKFSGIESSGAIIAENKSHKEFLPAIHNISLKPTIENIINDIKSRQVATPYIIQVFSLWPKEGKSYAIQTLKELLDKTGYTSQSVGFEEKDDQTLHSLKFTIRQGFDAENYNQVLKDKLPELTDVIFIEVPAISTNTFNTSLYKSAQSSLLVTDMCRTWSSADDYNLEKFKSNSIDGLFTLANKILPDSLEHMIGDIPKKRSKIRTFIKNRIVKRFFLFRYAL